MINKIFFKTFKKEINSKTNHNSDLKTLKAQVSLVNLIKTFAQAINIVFIRLLIEKNMSLFYNVIAYAENQYNRFADEVN